MVHGWASEGKVLLVPTFGTKRVSLHRVARCQGSDLTSTACPDRRVNVLGIDFLMSGRYRDVFDFNILPWRSRCGFQSVKRLQV